MRRVVIIGAGQAGASLAETLRKKGYDGAITMVGNEPHPPYQRPPLSKGYLLGEMPLERLFLRPAKWYDEHNVTLRLGVSATAIDRQARRVVLSDGDSLPYDRLALTTGATPRHPPAAIGGGLAGVYCVRNLGDVNAMQPEFTPGRRLLVVGGGYIGLEAAAVAAKLGLKVVLVEAAERILQRVAAPETAAWFRALHQRHGVEIIESAGLERLLGETRITGARLSDGRSLEADFAIVGIGITPQTGLAEAAGLAIDNGIKTNAQAQSSDPFIFAAGDCASTPWQGESLRLESVGNAIDQAAVAAANMLGEGVAYTPKPWFWSDQFDVKLQIAGLNTGYDRVVVRGAGESVSHWYYRGKTLLAVDAMNDPRAYMVGKRLVEAGRSPAPEMVADTGVELKTIMAAK